MTGIYNGALLTNYYVVDSTYVGQICRLMNMRTIEHEKKDSRIGQYLSKYYAENARLNSVKKISAL